MIDFRNCDCMTLLNDLRGDSVDLLLTDPPYGISFKSGSRKKKYDKIVNDDNLLWIPGWLDSVFNVVKPDAHLYIWCSWHKIDVWKSEVEKFAPVKNILVWNKGGGGMGDLSGAYGGVYELCLFVNLGRPLNPPRKTDVITGAYRTGNQYHPTQKPVNLMSYLIAKSSKEGDLVLDCFAGSGTTAIACQQTNRNFIGCELKKEYYEVAAKRINIETKQINLF